MPPKSLVKYIPDQSPTTIPFNDNELINSTINSLKNDLNISPAILYMISLSLNIANNYIHHTILIKGDYLLLGLRLKFVLLGYWRETSDPLQLVYSIRSRLIKVRRFRFTVHYPKPDLPHSLLAIST